MTSLAGATGEWPSSVGSGAAGTDAATATPTKLTGWLPMALGVLLIVLGAVWTMQGLDVITDSPMSDNHLWSLVGPIVGVAGLILIVLGVRLRSRAKKTA